VHTALGHAAEIHIYQYMYYIYIYIYIYVCMSQTGAGVWTLQADALHKYGYDDIDKVIMLQCVAVCCSVLQ